MLIEYAYIIAAYAILAVIGTLAVGWILRGNRRDVDERANRRD